ncbi:MAG TPA: DNA helicase RecQ [Thermoanaerobaculia bacterium]|nr:DNA helicase RecQ [Thermoanaerobaculia bacterium]
MQTGILTSDASVDESLLEVVSRHWGYDSLRPLQQKAMRAAMSGRDSLVVLPTGGGKSLCYQAPALLKRGLTVVVSPLISLMKDQVDGLVACGVAAAQINSSQSSIDQRLVERDLVEGLIRLLFVSPERLALSSCRQLLQRAGAHTFAIDEAHCISHWGHDFRPEYRQLRQLHELFPDASVHAYTATATEKVRADIIEQLGLRNALELVGSFDRPNLTYRIVPRRDQVAQIEEVISRHPKEAGIIYCIRRKDVDAVAEALGRRGHRVAAYHAGLSQEERRLAQEAFATEACDLVVATVAFGMGIDRSNVRFVLHTGMPKSIEHYQQETGRAGRDGLEAECVLLYSGSDSALWRQIMEHASSEEATPEFLSSAFRSLDHMQRYCGGSVCRHRALVTYFGQEYDGDSCGACDICLGDLEEVPDAVIIAKKIISCVVRLRVPFGVSYLVSVLRGEKLEKIRQRNHDELSTFGLLKDHPKDELRDWIHQLITLGCLRQEGEQYPVIVMAAAARAVLRDELPVRLVRLKGANDRRKSGKQETSWEGVDRDLFDVLRRWRKQEADRRGVPPFVIFSDNTLRQLATVRPSSTLKMRRIYGVGEAKLEEFGRPVIELITSYCDEKRTTMDLEASLEPRRSARPSAPSRVSAQREVALDVFRRGESIEEAMRLTGRARSTVVEYLAQFITEQRPPSIAIWVPDDRYAEIAEAARQCGADRLKPIRDFLGERVSYDDIRLVLAHLG